MACAVRVAHYARAAAESIALSVDSAKRGDAKGAASWAAIASGEAELARFWASPDSPASHEVGRPGFLSMESR